jgi:hypothetical protein
VPFHNRVSFKNHTLLGIGEYGLVDDLRHLMSELSRIEPSLPVSLANKDWTLEQFYIFKSATKDGIKETVIPVKLVLHDQAVKLNVVTEKIKLMAENADQLSLIHKLLEDYEIKYEVMD